jgi:peptidoglycan/LPS O-acetylase OafA/YrhL
MNKQLKSITGLRFLAAFLVVMHHFGTPKAPEFARNIVLHGFVAVTLFFVLSGFILSYSYFDDSGNIKTTHRNFWIARFARIYPVYLLGFVLFAPYAFIKIFKTGALSPWFDLSIFGAAALGLVQSWSTVTVGAWNPPAWSLSAEAFFYLVFPFIAPTILRLNIRRLAIVALILWILSIAAQLANSGSAHFDREFWMFNPLVRLPEFLLGIVLGRLWFMRKTSRFDNYSGSVAIVTTALIFVLLAVDANELWYFNGAIAPAMMLLIYCLASGRGVIARWLMSKPMVLLGEASYSLYLLHWPLWLAFSSYLIDDLLMTKGPLLFFACEILTIGASIVTFKFLEQPASRFIKKSLTARSVDRTSASQGAPRLVK